jgi:hypothetical protein
VRTPGLERSATVVNQVQNGYNDFQQLVTQYQAHGGAVNTSTSPKVQYSFADGSANTTRPTGLTYPSGRVVNYRYGSSGGANDRLSRIADLHDPAGHINGTFCFLMTGKVECPL